MCPSKRMFKHRLRGLSKSFGSQIDPGKSEELKRTKTDIETNLTRIAKLIKNEEQSRKDGNWRKEKELVGLIEDFYNQYQSLYAVYGPCIVDRLSSLSSSSSDSEYFSSEELDANTNTDTITNDTNQKPFSRERERSTSTLELVLKTQPSNDFEEHLKRNLELLCAKNADLHNRVLELELLLKESKGTVSVLQAKLKTNEDQATSKISELMAPINKFEQEEGKMEEKIRRNKNEAWSQKKDFTDQINVMQKKLYSVSNHDKDLEAQLERKREEVSQCLVRIENLGENLDEMASVEKSLLKEKECFLSRIKDLELEVESRNNELERAMAQRGEEISELLREHENSIHAEALKAEVEKLRLELDQKSMLNERSQKEYSESLAKMENLKTRVGYQEEMIKKLTERIEQIDAENKQAEILSKNVKLCQQSSERKMEELAEEFRKNMENNIRLLHQRIHVAEQLNNENKESCKITKERYEEENRRLGERIASYEDELRVRATTQDELREKQELLLREKVWKLEAKVSKEGGEKLNLMKAVSQLERKVRKLEKNLREKDEELISLGEKKREAIRQLCFLIEFHRDRCVYLKDLMSKRRVSHRK